MTNKGQIMSNIMVRMDRDIYKQLQQVKLDNDLKSVSDAVAFLLANQKDS